MPLRRKLQTVLRLRPAELALILEAVFMLAIARAMVLAVPFRALAPWLARAPDDGWRPCDCPVGVGTRRSDRRTQCSLERRVPATGNGRQGHAGPAWMRLVLSSGRELRRP